MSTVGLLLSLVGWIVSIVGSVMILIKAFQKSILWGLGSLFVPFVILVFVFMNWEETKKGFLIAVAGAVVGVIGGILAGAGAATAMALMNAG